MACATLADDIAKSVAAAATEYATALLQFWEQGLKLSPHGENCPMCEELTLTAAKRATLQARLKTVQERLAGNKQTVTDRDVATTALTRATQAMEHAGIAGLGQEDRSTLQTLLASKPEPLAAFLAAHDDLKSATDEATNASSALRSFLTGLSERMADAKKAQDVVADSKNAPARFSMAMSALKTALQRYAAAWTAFEPLLSAEISSTKAIAEIDAVGKAIKAQPEMKTLDCYEAVAMASRGLTQRVEAFLQQKQTTLLATRGAEIKAIYDQLNPGAQVTFQTKFMRRFLLHVLPKGFMRIRHYGLIANRGKAAKLAAARTALNQPAPSVSSQPETLAEFWKRIAGLDLARCPQCHLGTLQLVAVLQRAPRARAPPASP